MNAIFLSEDVVRPLVVDTNLVLDCFVFRDERARALRERLLARRGPWLATAPMRDELLRVLGYPAVAAWMGRESIKVADVMHVFAGCTTLVPPAPPVRVICRDSDDQKFVDLAADHAAYLLSRDKAVLSLSARLRPWGVAVGTAELIADRAAGNVNAQ